MRSNPVLKPVSDQPLLWTSSGRGNVTVRPRAGPKKVSSTFEGKLQVPEW
jgi:hypothetical protein